jgi:hypothetical protein
VFSGRIYLGARPISGRLWPRSGAFFERFFGHFTMYFRHFSRFCTFFTSKPREISRESARVHNETGIISRENPARETANPEFNFFFDFFFFFSPGDALIFY